MVDGSAAPAHASAAGLAPELPDGVDAPSGDEGERDSAASGSGDDSDTDDAAAQGFDDMQWQCLFDNGLPPSANNSCPPFVAPQRRRRSVDEDAHAPPRSDPMDGAPDYARDNCKPKARRIPRDCKSPHDFVQLLFPSNQVDLLVAMTNAAATEHPRLKDQQRFANWKAVTRKEMYLFLSVCIFLGVVKVQNRKLIWRKNGTFGQAWVQERMRLRRFETILNAFNCVRHWNLTDAQLAAKNKQDSFWQIRALVGECNMRCKFHFKMGRSFSIDEAVIPYKGRHPARCYNKSKPSKYHFKKFSLNCAATGYVYCHYHYPGKDEARPANVPATL